MLKNEREIMKFLDDEGNWETIDFSKEVRMKNLNLGDRSVRLIELRYYNPHLKMNMWYVSSMQLFDKRTQTFGPEIDVYELADYIEKHKNDEYIKDFKLKGDKYD